MSPAGSGPKGPFLSHPMAAVTPGPSTRWERYAQKPAWGLYTSTEVDLCSSYLIGSIDCLNDLGPVTYPYPRFRMTIAEGARVFEIDGPEAWHRLCFRYPDSGPGGLLGGLVVPDFAAVACDWDAVHLSLAGLLTAEQVVVQGTNGRTALQGWEAEATVWLRRAFDDVTRLPDLLEPPVDGPWMLTTP